MKQIVIILMIATIFSYSSSNLEVKIENSEKGVAYLYNTASQKLDTVVYENYSFSYSAKIEEPTLFQLYFEKIKNWDRPIYIILSKETTKIRFDSLMLSNGKKGWLGLYPNRPKFIKDPNNNEAFYQFQNLLAIFSDSVIAVSNRDKNNNIKKQREDLYNNFISTCGVIISENNDKLVSAFIMEYLMKNKLLKLSKIQEYYSFLDSNVQQSAIGLKIGKEASLKINSKAPDFGITDIKGNKYSLKDLKGKKILIHFWSTTCAPCIREIPKLLALNNSIKDITIINISLDTDYDKWKNGLTMLGMEKMINVCDLQGNKSKIIQDYYIKSIPANYLLSEDGIIIAKRQSVDAIIKELKRIGY